jgi:transcriptional regulator with XRE-family HTH domain
LKIGTGREFTAEQVAQEIGVDERTLRNWLYGETGPQGHDLLKLFAFFGPSFAGAVLDLIDCSVAGKDNPTAGDARAIERLRKLLPALNEALGGEGGAP